MATREIRTVLRAETSAYQRDMAAAAKATDAVGDAGAKAGTKGSSALSQLKSSAEQYRAEWTSVGQTLTGMGTLMAGLGGATLAVGINYNTLQQQSRAALKTLTGSAEEANAQMDKLDAFAKNSPFAKQTFIQAQQQMLGFGIEAEKVIPYLGAINDAVAAFGGSDQQISEIAFVMSQISAAGKITATDLMQLGQRGVDAATLIGSQMGMTGAEIRESITEGTLGAGEALDALAAGMSGRFGGAAEDVKATMTGAFDRVKAAYRDLASELATPLVNPEGGGLLVDATNGVADFMRTVEDVPGPIKAVAVSVAGLATAGALLGGGFLLLTPRILDTRYAMGELGISLRGAYSAARASLPTWGQYGTVLMRAGQSAKHASAETLAARTAVGGFLRTAGRVAGPIAAMTLATIGWAEKTGFANTAQMGLMGTMAGPWGAAIGGGVGLILDLSSATAGLREETAALEQQMKEMGGSFDGVEDVEAHIARLRIEGENLGDVLAMAAGRGLGGLKDALNVFDDEWNPFKSFKSSVTQGLDEADQLEKALDAVREARMAELRATEMQGQGIDALIAKRREEQDVLLGSLGDTLTMNRTRLDAAAAAKEHEGALKGVTDTEGKLTEEQLAALEVMKRHIGEWNALNDEVKNSPANYREMRASLIATAKQMGMNDKAARDLVDSYMHVPKKLETRAHFYDQTARATLRSYRDELNAMDGKTIRQYAKLLITGQGPAGGGPNKATTGDTGDILNRPLKKAGGGPVYGPGTSTSDSIPAWLSDGEFVIRAAAVDRYGLQLFEALNAEQFATGGLALAGGAAERLHPSLLKGVRIQTAPEGAAA